MKQLEGTKERDWAKALCSSMSKGESYTIKTFTGTAKECSEKIKDSTWFLATGRKYIDSTHFFRYSLLWNEANFYHHNSTNEIDNIPFTNTDTNVLITIYGLTNF